jgi:hypothetical protein
LRNRFSIAPKANGSTGCSGFIGDEIIADLEGQLLPGIDAARDEAMVSARELLATAIKSAHDPAEYVELTDRDGKRLLIVFLADLLPKKAPRQT